MGVNFAQYYEVAILNFHTVSVDDSLVCELEEEELENTECSD